MNILIVDDDKLVCTSLKTIIEANDGFHVVDIGNDGKDAISLYERHRPDVLLLDIRMKEINGLEAAKQILATHSEAKILFLTTFQDDEYIVKALHLGVKGYLLKQDFESIIPALTAVNSGQSVFGSEISEKIPTLLHNSSTASCSEFGITDKEYDIVEAVASGMSNKEISESLFLSEGTVRNYLSRILEKLDLRDRTQLAIFYYKNFS